MKYAIVYSSATGNTAALAEHLRTVLAPAGEPVYFGPADGAGQVKAERMYLGFWTDKGTCDSETARLLQGLTDTELCLFGTAGFGGAAAYFQQILERVAALVPAGNTVRPGFMCQGKMGPAVGERYAALLEKEPENPQYRQMTENFQRALSHPDQADLQALAAWAGSLE